jgi:hypothetical protein
MKLKAFKARGGGHCQQQISIFGLVRGHAVHTGRALAERLKGLKASQGISRHLKAWPMPGLRNCFLDSVVYLEHSDTAFL